MKNRFIVKTAENESELLGALALRHRVFSQELGANAPADGVETDGFDQLADHLILIDTQISDPEQAIVGTTRVLAQAGAPQGLYTAQSFDLSPLLSSGRSVIEVGRLCIAPSHRDGTALSQLFEGLRDYVLVQRGEVLVGTASFIGTDIASIQNSLALLNDQYALDTWSIGAIGPNAVETSDYHVDDRVAAVSNLPKALKSYLRMGARIGQGAVIDAEFNTIDVCAVLDVAQMTHRLARHAKIHAA